MAKNFDSAILIKFHKEIMICDAISKQEAAY